MCSCHETLINIFIHDCICNCFSEIKPLKAWNDLRSWETRAWFLHRYYNVLEKNQLVLALGSSSKHWIQHAWCDIFSLIFMMWNNCACAALKQVKSNGASLISYLISFDELFSNFIFLQNLYFWKFTFLQNSLKKTIYFMKWGCVNCKDWMVDLNKSQVGSYNSMNWL